MVIVAENYNIRTQIPKLRKDHHGLETLPHTPSTHTGSNLTVPYLTFPRLYFPTRTFTAFPENLRTLKIRHPLIRRFPPDSS